VCSPDTHRLRDGHGRPVDEGENMRRLLVIAALLPLMAACRDNAKEAADRADRAMALVAELQQRVADLQDEVSDLDDELDQLDPDGAGPDDDAAGPSPRYAAARSPDRAFGTRVRAHHVHSGLKPAILPISTASVRTTTTSAPTLASRR
jgi:hypothetical protein